MDRKRSSSTLVTRNLCRRFIRERHPKELDFFDTIWDIFIKLARPLRQEEKQKKQFKFFRTKTVSALGFTEAEVLDLVTPSVIAVISAATYHLSILEEEIEEKEIKELVDTYAQVYGVKKELREEINSFLIPLLKLELSRLKPIKRKPEAKGKYEVTISGKEGAKDFSDVGLKIGIRDARPYVEIDGKEITDFRDREATFARLALLGAAQITKDPKYKNGYVSKEDLFDRGSHEVSRIRGLLSAKLENIPFGLKGKIVQASKDGRVRLNIKVEIDNSISNFRSKYVGTLNRKIEQMNQILIIPPDADKLYIIETIATLNILWKNFEKLVFRMGRDIELIKLAMQMANKGEYDDSEYKKLMEKARRLKERIKQMFPDFFEEE